jgi:hypothetical protein
MNRGIGFLLAAGCMLMFASRLTLMADQASKPMVPMAMNKMSLLNNVSRALRDEDRNDVAAIRDAGHGRDQFQIPHIVEVLSKPPHFNYVYTGLHALAQMGAIEALSTVDLYVNDPSGYVSNYAVVAKARLLAESNANSMTDAKQVPAAKVARFYKELGLTSADLNAALLAFNHPELTASAKGPWTTGLPPLTPIGVYAMRELADMAYDGPYQDYISLPEVARVNFKDDYPSALKMRLAPLSREQRLHTLIEELANKKTLRMDDYYERQLAINEGKAASRLAAQKLQEMGNHHEQYASGGFSCLFGIIEAVGDKEQAPVVESFLNVTYPAVSHYAHQSYRDIKNSVRSDYKHGY